MRFLLLFILASMLVACSNPEPNTDTPSTAEEDTAEPLQWLTLSGKEGAANILLVSGDEEYRSEEALPMLAKILSERYGFNATVLFAQDPEHPGIVDPNYTQNIPGLEQLAKADMMILFTRFRALPDDQMQHIDKFLKEGKPLLAIRTATHAFKFKDENITSNFTHYGNYHTSEDDWNNGFGRLVMGEHWVAHHGVHASQSTRALVAPGAQDHPLTNGIEDGDVWGPTDVYEVRLPLPGDAEPILLGQVMERTGEMDEDDPLLGMRSDDAEVASENKKKDKDGNTIKYNPNDPMMPVAWTKTYQLPGGQPGNCFATTIGSSTDLLAEGTRRLMLNATFWLLDQPVPEKANVDLIGTYKPSRFAFHTDEHWDKKKIRIAELQKALEGK